MRLSQIRHFMGLTYTVSLTKGDIKSKISRTHSFYLHPCCYAWLWFCTKILLL